MEISFNLSGVYQLIICILWSESHFRRAFLTLFQVQHSQEGYQVNLGSEQVIIAATIEIVILINYKSY